MQHQKVSQIQLAVCHKVHARMDHMMCCKVVSSAALARKIPSRILPFELGVDEAIERFEQQQVIMHAGAAKVVKGMSQLNYPHLPPMASLCAGSARQRHAGPQPAQQGQQCTRALSLCTFLGIQL